MRSIAVVSFAVLAVAAFGQIASDNAGNSAYTSGWANGSNGGSGFGPWQFNKLQGTPPATAYLATNSFVDIKTGGRAWGTACAQPTGSYSYAELYRPFSQPLAVGDTFSIDLDNGLLIADGSTFQAGGWGIALESAGGVELLGFYGWSWNAPNNVYWCNELQTIPIITSGFNFACKLTSASTYELKLTPIGGSTSTFNGTFKNTPNTIKRVRIWHYNTLGSSSGDYDFYFNNMKIESAAKTVSGTLDFGSGFTGDINGPITIPVLFEVKDSNGAVVQTTTVSVTPSGQFGSYSFTLAGGVSGDVTIKADAPTHLVKKSGTLSANSNIAANFVLTNGDVDDDDVVSVFDYIVLSDAFDAAFGDAAYVDGADLDKDGVVSVFDYITLSDAFDQAGDRDQ